MAFNVSHTPFYIILCLSPCQTLHFHVQSDIKMSNLPLVLAINYSILLPTGKMVIAIGSRSSVASAAGLSLLFFKIEQAIEIMAPTGPQDARGFRNQPIAKWMVEIETFPLFVDCLLHCRGSNGYQHLIELFFSFLFVQVPSYLVEPMTISNSTICLILKRGNMLPAAEAAERLNLRKRRSLCSSICEHGQLFGRPPLAV